MKRLVELSRLDLEEVLKDYIVAEELVPYEERENLKFEFEATGYTIAAPDFYPIVRFYLDQEDS